LTGFATEIYAGLTCLRRLVDAQTKSVFPRLFENLGNGRVREGNIVEFFS